MSRHAPHDDIDEADLEVTEPKDAAAGTTAVAVSMKRAVEQMGVRRTAKTLPKLNQTDGFDCQGCAWPDPSPEHRHTAEFCENGVKAVAEEATLRRAGPEFFAAHPIEELHERTDYWLGQQGRITEPMVLRAGGTHYEPISWDDAFAMIGRHLNGLASPDEAIFYTSGKTSNEAAFAYQLFVRAFGTNNLPDCSNMCHESTSVGLAEVIGIGKASVTYDDVHDADLLVIAGQNPGTNHPRMLTALEAAKKNGAKIIAINPLKEAGLVRFKNPQTPRGVVGHGTGMADLHLPVRINGDLALFQAIAVAAGRVGPRRPRLRRPAHLRLRRLRGSTCGALDWDLVLRSTGLGREEIETAARMIADVGEDRLLLGDGHHPAPQRRRHGQGDRQPRVPPGQHRAAGRRPVPGARPLQRAGRPHHGHLGAPPERPSSTRCATSSASSPRASTASTPSPRSRRCATATPRSSSASAATSSSAMSDTAVTEDAMRQAALTVHVSTKPNRSHVVHGREALILPALGRSEKDLTGGRKQRVTVEDSLCSVHASQGPLEPASPHLRSEVDIVCSLALATIGDRHGIGWAAMRDDYTEIRRRIAHVVPGCAGYDEKVDRPGGFVLPHPPRDTRTFPTEKDRAIFTVSPTEVLHVPEGRLLLQTMRSHDQFNTTIYGLDDRYRGIKDGRRVVFVNPDDIESLGLRDGQFVDLVSEWEDGEERRRREVPGGLLRHPPRLHRRLLPGDQRAGGAGLQGRGQQPAGLQVGGRAARAPRRRARARTAPTASASATASSTDDPEQKRTGRAAPPVLTAGRPSLGA